MKSNRTIKALTLVSFVTLFACFIEYKSGAFDDESPAGKLKMSGRKELLPNPGDISGSSGNLYANSMAPNVSSDTPPVKNGDTFKHSPAMMYSSKSIISIDQKIIFPDKDSLKRKSTKKKSIK